MQTFIIYNIPLNDWISLQSECSLDRNRNFF